MHHAEALARATGGNAELYQWSPVPQTLSEAEQYVRTALAWRDAGTAMSFATVRLPDSLVVGSTRFFNLEFGPGRRVTNFKVERRRTRARSGTPG
jgi:hypothetical protein